MNDIKLAILCDVGLSNNGYTNKRSTIVNIRNSTGNTLSNVATEFKSLVDFGHLRLVAKSNYAGEYYCLPEDYARVVETLKELQIELQ